MKLFFTILFLFSFLISFGQEIEINGTSPHKLRINASGVYTKINEIWSPEDLPDSIQYTIEYKSANTKYASLIRMLPGINTVSYKYFDYKDSLIGTGNVSTPTDDRPMSVIQGDVFNLLGLELLRIININTFFFEPSDGTNYWAFGNHVDDGWPDFPWYGRRGGAHLGGGRIGYQPYSTVGRLFGTRVVKDHVDDGTDIRGGSVMKIIGNDTTYIFTAFYETADTFKCLTVTKYINGTFLDEDTLLWKVGGHGGINETTWERFNFYGPPIVKGDSVLVPWYEHQNAVIWRVNYLRSFDGFQTWQNVNIDTNQVGETVFARGLGDTVIALGRFDNNVPLYFNYTTDFGTTWHDWAVTNLGSSKGRVMAAALNTPEYGLVVVYGDRGTNNVMLSKNNAIADIIADPTSFSTPQIIYTTGNDDLYHPLGYPSLMRPAQYRMIINFSEHNPAGISDGQARLKLADGALP